MFLVFDCNGTLTQGMYIVHSRGAAGLAGTAALTVETVA